MKPPRRVALSPQVKGCRGAGESWRAGSDRCSRAGTVADRRIGRKPEDAEESTAVEVPRAARPACELACCREANPNRHETAAGAGTIGGHRVYLLDGMGARRREKKENRGEKIRQSVGRAALREQSPCERSRVDRKERVFLRWKRKSKIVAAWERCRGRARNGRCCNCRACRRALAPANGGADGMGGAFGARGRVRACRFRPRAAHRGRWRLRWRAGRRCTRRLVRRR